MRLTCLVDNCVPSSRLWGEHGLAFLIETSEGNVLWDTGQSGTVLLHNLEALSLTKTPLAAVALSHGHHDHTGGLSALLGAHPGLPIYGHQSLLDQRYSLRDGRIRNIGIEWTRQQLECRATLGLSDAPQEIINGVWTTGGIHRRPYPQGASPHHVVYRDGRQVPDPYADDISLVLLVEGGVVLLCGCCHAGLRNTMARVGDLFPDEPLAAIVGGTHLGQADGAELRTLVDVLGEMENASLHLNHCTGERALFVLKQALGKRVRSCPVGTVLEF